MKGFLSSIIEMPISELLPYEVSSDFPCPEGPWILTYTRKKFSFTNPSIDAVDIRDIARTLAWKCRFNGHLDTFYSVAQHSVLISYLVPQEHAFWGLMHDATEAYVSDVPAPLKSILPQYKIIENNIMDVICDKFGLPQGEPPIVKHFDKKILANEIRDLFGPNELKEAQINDGLPDPHPVLNLDIIPWSMDEAECRFMSRFLELQAD